MKKVCVFITASPEKEGFLKAISYINDCLSKKKDIIQIFFYAEASIIASLDNYSDTVDDLIALTDRHNINLFVCSAAFQSRGFELSCLGKENFQFMGLGQFVFNAKEADNIGVFS